ncbi:MAG: nicotinate-nucleotide adenylyltransferase [Gammaproteobacteria bacterium]|nr:nicotinate-nucleotide adenylyltransferase [Gammaproteobacteria bacterium]
MGNTIGILGGTFDPVHNGHLRLALEIQQQLDLSGVRLIPLNIPPHRDPPAAGSEHRLKMLVNACNGVNGLIVDDREINREQTSWTIDTVMSLREEFPDHSLCLIMGEDAFAGLDSWRSWNKLTDYVHLVVASRISTGITAYPDTVKKLLEERETDDPATIKRELNGYIIRVPIPMLEISSSRIRELLASNQAVDFLLPQPVLDYILEQQLYR